MLATRPIDLERTPDLQEAVEAQYAAGARTIELEGVYRPQAPGDSLLHISPNMSGLTLAGREAVLDGQNVTSHVVLVDGAAVTIEGLRIVRGDTTSPERVGRQYAGRPRERSVYEAVDGAGVLILGDQPVDISNTGFLDNQSGMCGGGLSHQGTALLMIRDCLFQNNLAASTGSAIDNLTPGANLAAIGLRLVGNRSNVSDSYYGPHGQISVFKHTRARIEDCDFEGGSFPVDAYEAEVHARNLTYDGQPAEVRAPGGHVTRLNDLHNRWRHIRYGHRLAQHDLHLQLRPADPKQELSRSRTEKLLKLASRFTT